MKTKQKFLILLRHGIAEDKSSDGSDAERRLTEAGAKRMKKTGKRLAKLAPDIDTIYSSPLVRCVESATLVAKSYDLGVTTSDALRPEAPAEEFRKLIDEMGGENVICAGHEPTLTRFMIDLTGMQSGRVSLKKGGCYGIRISANGEAELEWMLTPGFLNH